MSRKNLLAHATSPDPVPPPVAVPEAASPARVGAIGKLGSILRDMTVETDRATQFERASARGQVVVEINPEIIDPAPIRDRLSDPTIDDTEQLRQSITESGQRVPVLLRPSVSRPGRYTTVFGHRRIAVARQLGRHVSAIVAAIGEEDALIAQAQENNDRQDTSYIERCLYAHRLLAHGLKSVAIARALSLPKSTVSEFTSIVDDISEPLILAIGRAPEIGRRRWLALAAKIRPNASRYLSLVADPAFAALPSTQRFTRLLDALASLEQVPSKPANKSLTDGLGTYAMLRRTSRGVLNVTIPPIAEPARPDGLSFADWIETRLQALRQDYRAGK